LNKLANALEHGKQAIKLEPENLEYYKLVANIYTVAHNLDSAIAMYNKILSIDSTETEALYNLGRIYKYDKPLKALEIFNKALDIVGPNWSILVEIAELNERLGNVDATINSIEKLLELNPAEIKLQKLLIESYMKANRLDDALSLTEQALTTFPDDLNLIEYKANILLAKGDKSEAGKEYGKIIESNEIPFDSKIKIAAMFLTNESDSLSVETAKNLFNLIAKDSVNWQVNVYLGEIAIKQNDDSSAVKYLLLAADEAPWNAQIWGRLAERLFFMGENQKIIEKIGPVIDDFPDDFFLHLILGLANSNEGKDEIAETYLMKAVELNPNDPIALSSLGFSLNQLKKADEALYYLNRAKKINPKDLQVWTLLGIIYNAKKQFDKSDEAYERALEIDSTNALVLNNYAYSLAERGIQLERAERMSRLSLETEPDNSSYLDTYGWILYRLGKYEEALEYINKAIGKEEKNSTLLDHLGDVYFKLNQIDKAIMYWNKALEHDKNNTEIQKKIEEASL